MQHFPSLTACVADFWTSDLHQQEKSQDPVLDQNHSSLYLYVNPVTVEETPTPTPNPNKDLKNSSTSKLETIPQNISSSLQNGETSQQVTQEVKGQTKPTSNPEIKYKRPPPRPPSLSSGTGMGLLFSSPSPVHNSSSADRKEEGRGGGGEREERKSVSTSPPPSRPPVPLQGRAAPPVPPAPLHRTSSRKSTDREGGEGTEREKGQNPAKKTEKEGVGEKGEEKAANKPEDAELENSSKTQEEEVKKEGEKTKKEDEKEEKEVKEEDKEKSSSQNQLLVKKPSRPVPPPRRKPCAPGAPVFPNQASLIGQSASVKAAPPSPARRPDVSLYSPQGGAALGTDPDSCSTSSTEEEGDLNQEQEQNQR